MSSDDAAGPGPGPAPVATHPLLTRLTQAGQRLRQADGRHRWVLDTAVTIAVFLMTCLPDLIHDGDVVEPRGPRELQIAFAHLPLAGTLALQIALVLPLLWRRRAPVPAFGVIAAAFLVQWSLDVFLRADFALLIALYSVAVHGRLRQLPWVCAATLGVMVPLAVKVSAVFSLWESLFLVLCAVTAAAALGLAVRIRRTQLASLRERTAILELERDQRSKLAAATERARVAREMHDIIGHSLSVIITLADGGSYAAETRPDRGKEALRLVGDAGRQALGEMRRMLGVLREQSDTPELNPQPRIADLDALCARIRAAGPVVVYQSGGDLDALDRGVQLMAYRIVQEALTNTLKHAGPRTHAHVQLTAEDTRLSIRVHDTGTPDQDGPPARSPVEGHGLAGIRERAALYDGTVSAGPGPGGGWTVQTVLDLSPRASGGAA